MESLKDCTGLLFIEHELEGVDALQIARYGAELKAPLCEHEEVIGQASELAQRLYVVLRKTAFKISESNNRIANGALAKQELDVEMGEYYRNRCFYNMCEHLYAFEIR